MTTQDYAALPEELGLREVNEGKKILVTTFLLPRTVSKAALGALFRQRWHVELDLRAIKTTLQMADLSCNTPEMNVTADPSSGNGRELAEMWGRK